MSHDQIDLMLDPGSEPSYTQTSMSRALESQKGTAMPQFVIEKTKSLKVRGALPQLYRPSTLTVTFGAQSMESKYGRGRFLWYDNLQRSLSPQAITGLFRP